MMPSTSRPGPIAAPAVSTTFACTILMDRHDLVRPGPASSDSPSHLYNAIMKLKWLILYLKYRRYIVPGLCILTGAVAVYFLFLRHR